jgi:CRISPR/Cas system-associated protein Cas10 (large subunit of type III CRISPR-Cas system)
MLIVGDVSGIQEFVFALPEEQGGQARMLRARSFYVQTLAEVLAWRVQRALGPPAPVSGPIRLGRAVRAGIRLPQQLRSRQPRLRAIEGQ